MKYLISLGSPILWFVQFKCPHILELSPLEIEIRLLLHFSTYFAVGDLIPIDGFHLGARHRGFLLR